MDAEGRLAILLMFSVKLVQEVHVAGELIPDQYAVLISISQPSRESAGMECFAHTDPGSDDWIYFDYETKGQKATLFKPGSHLYPQHLRGRGRRIALSSKSV